jgi:3,4-dihydroxy-2-butanone 4-phosphate synthase
VHERTATWVRTVHKTSRSTGANRPVSCGHLVPLVASDGHVVSWVGVTEEDVERDLAPRSADVTPPARRRGADDLRVDRRMAAAFADRFEGQVVS